MIEREYRISRFATEHDTAPKHDATTWSQLVSTFSTVRRCACFASTCARGRCPHKLGAAWSPAIFRPEARRRTQQNVEGVSLLSLDIDHATDAELTEYEAQLANYRHIAHGTHSDSAGDRCVRVLLPLSRVVNGAEWRRFWPTATSMLGIQVDPKTRDATRIYFLPSRPSDAEFYFAASDGIEVDVDAVLAIAVVSAPTSSSRPSRSTKRRLDPGERHGALLTNAVRMRALGAERDEIAAKLAHTNGTLCTPPKPTEEIKRIADWAAELTTEERVLVNDASPFGLAAHVLSHGGHGEEGPNTLARWAGAWWRFDAGIYRRLEDETLRAEVWRELRAVVIEKPDEDGASEREQLNVGSRRVSEVIDAMNAQVDRVEATSELPFALPGYEGPPRGSFTIVGNGLLCLSTMELHPSTSRLFATTGAAVHFDAEAQCPQWKQFLAEIFTDDTEPDYESIRLVGQIFGWLVAGDVARQVIPLFVGPKRSGKSTMMSVLRELVGIGNTCAPPLASLSESRFGLAPLLGKSVAIIPDARLGVRADEAAVAGLLLAVSGRDPVTIDRKGREAIEARLGCRIVIVTNELPRITDASGALASRFLIVETRRSFLGQEDLQLEGRLHAELPGILVWALAGWRDLVENGWVRPSRTDAIVAELDRLGSPIRAFISDRLIVEGGRESTLRALYQEWQRWCFAKGGTAGHESKFARDLRAALPAVRSTRRRVDAEGRDRREVAYTGVGLRSGEDG